MKLINIIQKGAVKMNSINNGIGMEGMRVKFQTLWIFAMLNYIYCDVLGLHDSTVLKELITGHAGSLQVTQGFLLGAAILMETAIAMVLLSRVLKYSANRWANIIVGVIHTAAVSLSMFVGKPALYYIFFGTIEVVCTSLIVWYAWRWPNPEA
jgi:hypothetical protein